MGKIQQFLLSLLAEKRTSGLTFYEDGLSRSKTDEVYWLGLGGSDYEVAVFAEKVPHAVFEPSANFVV